MTCLQSCNYFIRNSHKRLEGFNSLLRPVSGPTPTRWVMRFRSLDSFVVKCPCLITLIVIYYAYLCGWRKLIINHQLNSKLNSYVPSRQTSYDVLNTLT